MKSISKALFAVVLFALVLTFPWTNAFAAKISGNENPSGLWRAYRTRLAQKIVSGSFPYEKCFRAAAKKTGIPLSLLLAVARGESNFNPKAASNKDCHGVMQIQWPGTAGHLGIDKKSDLFDPCINIMAGAEYLKELLGRYNGDIHLALAAYNYGPGRIPQNAKPGAIPKGARWYSGYIHHHLRKILKNDSKGSPVLGRKNQLKILVFNRPFRAKAFLNHLEKNAPELSFDWFRLSPGRFQVSLTFADEKELARGLARLRALGLAVSG